MLKSITRGEISKLMGLPNDLSVFWKIFIHVGKYAYHLKESASELLTHTVRSPLIWLFSFTLLVFFYPTTRHVYCFVEGLVGHIFSAYMVDMFPTFLTLKQSFYEKVAKNFVCFKIRSSCWVAKNFEIHPGGNFQKIKSSGTTTIIDFMIHFFLPIYPNRSICRTMNFIWRYTPSASQPLLLSLMFRVSPTEFEQSEHLKKNYSPKGDALHIE